MFQFIILNEKIAKIETFSLVVLGLRHHCILTTSHPGETSLIGQFFKDPAKDNHETHPLKFCERSLTFTPVSMPVVETLKSR